MSRYREDRVSDFYRWLAARVYSVARRFEYQPLRRRIGLDVRFRLERLSDALVWRAITRAMRQMDRRETA